MANVFSRSWEITKLSFGVMKQDKELVLYPLLAAVFSLLFTLFMVFPYLLSFILGEVVIFAGLEVLIVFVIYLGLSFIATYFNVAVVYTAKKRFSGGDATFKESMKYGLSKVRLILMWSLVSATVGIFLYLLERVSQKMGIAGRIIMSIMTSVLGMIWSIVTIFVVPGMVYHDLTPFDAIKKSVAVLKKTWGESLIRYYGLGLVQGMLSVAGILVAFGLFLLLAPFGGLGALIAIVIGLIYLIGLTMVFSVANTIYNTALYVFASSGKVPKGFSSDVLKNAFTNKKTA